MSRAVVVTGASGLIGQLVERELGAEYEVRGLDRARRLPGAYRSGDLRKVRSVLQAFAGSDVVVDLAADARPDADWESVYGNNLLATFNAFEAARQSGVRRVVFASSNHVTGMYEREEPYASIVSGRYRDLDPSSIPRIGSDAPIRPDGLYAVGKAFGEALGRLYAEEHGLSVICLRIGTVNAADRPTQVRHFATLLTHADLLQLVRCAIDVPRDVRFAVVYGVSKNTWRFWDIDEASRALGYEPRDDAESWRELTGDTL